LIWPLLAFGFLAGKRQLRPLIALALILVCVCFGALYEICRFVVFPYSSILIGCVTALYAPQLSRLVVERGLAYPALVVAAVLQLGLATRAESPWATSLTTTGYGIAVALLLLSALSEASALRSLLAWSPLAYVGRVSYGIYLIHILCIHVVTRFCTAPFQVFGWTCVASVGAASLLYYFVERPLIGLGRTLSSRIQQKSGRQRHPCALSKTHIESGGSVL